MPKSRPIPTLAQMLVSGQVEALIARIFENERPLQGVVGHLDWRFRGQITSHLRKGSITGQEGECIYIPMRHHEKTYRLILLGCGRNISPGFRQPPPAFSLGGVSKNLKGLGLRRIGLSGEDFGGMTQHTIPNQLGGFELWIL